MVVGSPGGCINASPAGKRRIATGSEPQLTPGNPEAKEDGDLEAAASSLVAHPLIGGTGANGGGVVSQGGGLLVQFSSPFAAITALAVAACLLILLVFVTIFAALQVS